MDISLRHFEAFLAVARLGTFTRAASALHVSQPALTVQIKQLERRLGLRLFDRTNRRVSLTDAGRDLMPPAERLLVDLEALLRHATDMAEHRRGIVTVAALPSVAAGLLPEAIRTLTARHHGIEVRVRDVVGERVVELVKAGEAEVGIGTLTRPDADIVADALFSDRLCVFAPAGHGVTGRPRLTLREATAHPLILTGRDSSVRQLVERALEDQKIAARVAHEAAYMTTALAMVRAGLGVAILPESAQAGAAHAEVRAIPIHRPRLMRQVSLITRRGTSRSPAAEQFVAILRTLTATR